MDLHSAVGPGQGQQPGGCLDRSRPRRVDGQRGGRPQVDTGGHGGGGVRAQRCRPGQPRSAEDADGGRRPGVDRPARQLVLAAGLCPRAAVHTVGVHRQIEPGDVSRVQPADQRGLAGELLAAERHAERVADLGRHHVQWNLDGALEDSPFGADPCAGVGVIGVQGALVDSADHDHRRPQNDERPECVRFAGAQRPHRVKGPDRGDRRRRFAAVVVQHARYRRRQFADGPGPHQVAEVDEPVRQPVRADDDVVVGDIAVDDLDRQVVGQIGDRAPGLGGRRQDRLAAVRVGDVAGQGRHGALGMPKVPLQHPVHARMVEGGQRAAGAPGQIAEGGHPVGAQIEVPAQRPAREIGDDSREQGVLIGGLPADLCDRRAPVDRGADAFGRGEERRRGVLGLQFQAGEGRVGDLEHPDRLGDGGAQQEVRVLVAAQSGSGGPQSEVFGGDGLGLRGGDRRDRQLGGLEEIERSSHWPSSHQPVSARGRR